MPQKINQATSESAVHDALLAGKYKTALELARTLHKSSNTPASERLLIDAYVMRIRALTDHNLMLEAKALMDLVVERFPSATPRIDALRAVSAAAAGSPQALLGALADNDLSPERRREVEKTIQNEVADVSAIANFSGLPAEHPLRIAAAAIEQAFTAVTSGAVSEEQVALPEVSRRSPLAQWKLLIRAIWHFHRSEDALCRENLDAIDPQSVAARAVPRCVRLSAEREAMRWPR